MNRQAGKPTPRRGGGRGGKKEGKGEQKHSDWDQEEGSARERARGKEKAEEATGIESNQQLFQKSGNHHSAKQSGRSSQRPHLSWGLIYPGIVW